MAGRHRAQPARRGRGGKHRAPAAHSRGLVSLAAVTALTAIGGGAAYYALQNNNSPAPPPSSSKVVGATAEARIVPATPTATATSGTKARSKKRAAVKAQSARTKAAKRRRAQQNRAPAPVLTVDTLSGPSWVQVVTADGTQLIGKVVPAHHHLTVDVHHLRLTLGNAGAVELVVEGHRIRPAGRQGEVRHFTVR